MPFITTDVTMEITMISRKPMGHKPHWISVDSTTLTLPNGKEIYFDFVQSYGDAEVLEDGRVEIHMTKSSFDVDHYLAEEVHTLELLDWEEIAKSKFTNIYIVGDSSENKHEDLSIENFIITSVSFDVFGGDGDNRSMNITLTQEQLTYLNQSSEKSYP